MKISLNNIGQIYDGKKVLSDISFDVNESEFITLIGPSGCGKSTIFKIITGLEKNYTGNVIIDGTDIEKYQGKLAYMPQNDLLLDWRTLYKNAVLPMEIEKTDKKTMNERIKKLLPEFKLSGEEGKYPYELSGGMKKRTALLRTFLVDSDIMLLDEPFGALDAITRSEMQQFLLEVCEKHRHTVLFITHDIDEAVYLSDRIIVLGKNPAVIKGEIKIQISKPRNTDVLLEREFLEYKKKIMDMLV
ncbi:Aliphatic sulfonates import ATP-binding protein SsuB [Sebaldella termitidis]|jgi:putative hydroxymethylpyrimidine transport system ATP-binding protein|uniref:ABC transporter related protein n=1 Tax=Sebaldella termitidis (strain ATCC 33386 / NCTC 11300) TaxID=526218 RepID=D1AK05_SEBTE|nr:ABC transporter ATP-binding protein [Sebaldella termitidis]ACZ08921.1 ABC transporter related protein [Sebaldella termitidis ATCC 33386]SUI24241.1 Aliphatic sulfonates import ATP-binding protein SsuB [Sebaldella termitidis]